MTFISTFLRFVIGVGVEFVIDGCHISEIFLREHISALRLGQIIKRTIYPSGQPSTSRLDSQTAADAGCSFVNEYYSTLTRAAVLYTRPVHFIAHTHNKKIQIRALQNTILEGYGSPARAVQTARLRSEAIPGEDAALLVGE